MDNEAGFPRPKLSFDGTRLLVVVDEYVNND